MAYGKIKADTLVWDNSGSDVETTIQSLTSADEGTAVKSTGESGGTKFLREDGDGTCSWQTIPEDTDKADKASPTFTGTVTIPTPTAGDNTTKAASTAFVATSFAPKASPSLTGILNLDGSYQQAFDVITSATSPAIDCALGNYFTLDLSSTNVSGTWTFTNVPTTKSFAIAIEITTGASTTVAWNSVSVNGGGGANTIKWNGGAAPELGASKPSVVILTTDDTGASWYGSALVDFATV